MCGGDLLADLDATGTRPPCDGGGSCDWCTAPGMLWSTIEREWDLDLERSGERPGSWPDLCSASWPPASADSSARWFVSSTFASSLRGERAALAGRSGEQDALSPDLARASCADAEATLSRLLSATESFIT